jgi:predicted membrane channel-forming protein YqfA (hemolysin III family)
VCLGLFCIACIGGFYLYTSAWPQPQAYHDFADQRPLLGLPHMLNVLSNLPFLIVGVWGLAWMAKEAFANNKRANAAFIEPVERWPYAVFFLGLVLTAFGSAYYHADPTNDRLMWDRIGLAITLMALFTAVLAERLDWRLAGWLLGPLVLLGVGSVIYWHFTEVQQAGDMRLYLVVQFFPLLCLPVLLLFFPPRCTGTADLTASLACYVVAKVLEIVDRQVYAQGGLVSGHTMKHLVAGLGAYFVLFMLQRRRPFRAAIVESRMGKEVRYVLPEGNDRPMLTSQR